MGFSDRIWSNGNIQAVSPNSVPPQPFTPSSLLLQLGVLNADTEERNKAIAQWLASNTPNALLRATLETEGYSVSKIQLTA